MPNPFYYVLTLGSWGFGKMWTIPMTRVGPKIMGKHRNVEAPHDSSMIGNRGEMSKTGLPH